MNSELETGVVIAVSLAYLDGLVLQVLVIFVRDGNVAMIEAVLLRWILVGVGRGQRRWRRLEMAGAALQRVVAPGRGGVSPPGSEKRVQVDAVVELIVGELLVRGR